jgi:hypothetical protein
MVLLLQNHALKNSKTLTKASQSLIDVVETEHIDKICITYITLIELNIE